MSARQHQDKQKIIAIVGPTASGKTSLGVALAKKLRGEVISADSRQLYRGMDIIASTPTKKEMRGVLHHLLRVADPKRQYSAGSFVRESTRHIADIARRGKMPIVVGGTGFYADALLSGWMLPEVPPNKKLRAKLARKSARQMFAQLKRLDPRRAADIDPHNPARLIRAIEIAYALGSVPLREETADNRKFDVLWLGLSPAAKVHRRAIRARIRARLKQGLCAEAKRLRARLSKKRYAELGAEFRLLADCLDRKISKATLAQKLEQWELAYAKRQLRWHKRNKNIAWVKTKQEALRRARKFVSN